MAKATKATKKTFLDTFENNGNNISNACDVIEINRATYYKWYDKYPNFKRAIEDIKERSNEELVVMAKVGLRVNLNKNKQSTIEYVLNNKTHGEYSNTRRNEISGKDGLPINVNFIIKMANE